MKKHKFKFLMA